MANHKNPPIKEHIQNNVVIDENGCWIWKKYTDRDGYGNCTFKGKVKQAHRVSYLAFRGEVPDDKMVCHHCDIPSCVNPEHLYVGDHFTNAQDKHSRGRNKPINGESNNMAVLTEQQVLEIRSNYTGKWGEQIRLCKKYGISSPHMSAILKGKYWKHI